MEVIQHPDHSLILPNAELIDIIHLPPISQVCQKICRLLISKEISDFERYLTAFRAHTYQHQTECKPVLAMKSDADFSSLAEKSLKAFFSNKGKSCKHLIKKGKPGQFHPAISYDTTIFKSYRPSLASATYLHNLFFFLIIHQKLCQLNHKSVRDNGICFCFKLLSHRKSSFIINTTKPYSSNT